MGKRVTMSATRLFAILVCGIIAVVACTSESITLPPNHFWFTQKLDHFDSLNRETWKQLFWVNDTFYKPVFLGGEAPIHFFDFQEVSALDWAAQNGAVYVALEHRFYGQSNPKPDLSVGSLRYLSSELALADAAVFVDTLKNSEDPRFSGPWLVLGCSYSGALSAWFRTKYPHLVVGSIAPSAPVWAVWDFYQFFENFAQQAPTPCVSATRAATDKMSYLLKSASGRRQLAAAFNACEPFDSDIDIFNFKYTVVTFLATTAQWENPGNAPPNGFQMTQACNMLTSSQDYVTNWGRAFISLQATPGQCTSFKFSSFLDPIRNPNLGNIDRSWWWQSCTEFGYFATTHGAKSTIFFPDMTIDIINSWCSKMFDVDGLTPNTNWTNSNYGGLRADGSNILFTNGIRDPWHTLSINQSPSVDRNVLAVTYDAAHCAPMDAPDPHDPPSLIEARAFISSWIKELFANAPTRRS